MPPRPERQSFWRRARLQPDISGACAGRWMASARATIPLSRLSTAARLGGEVGRLRGKSVLIAVADQMTAAILMIELDGVARRMLLCPPGLDSVYLPAIMADAEVDAVVADFGMAIPPGVPTLHPAISAADPDVSREVDTQWVLFTSGTTGRPKMVVHSLDSLSGPLNDGLAAGGAVWSTFYDIRRYGGLQILFRAMLGGGSMVFSDPAEPASRFLARAGEHGVTHISGTPSHWRLALMSETAGRIDPGYVRLSGEVADQPILDALRAAYPRAQVAHAFASTEAGVAFDVRDGLAGFPVTLLEQDDRLRVINGTLRIRGSRTASGLLGQAAQPISDGDGFVDTGDVVELVAGGRYPDRYQFRGRREGVINVGGQKVYPEEVEAVINSHPQVRASHVWGRPSPITGRVVAADIVLSAPANLPKAEFDVVAGEIRTSCRRSLASHKVPVSLRAVTALAVAASGKLARAHA